MADTKISGLTDGSTPQDADAFPVSRTTDVANRKITWANIKTALTTLFDGLYDALGSAATAEANAIAASQPVDADLTAFAALDATAGVMVKTGAAAYARRTITGTTNEITVTDGSGAAGNPTISLSAAILTAITDALTEAEADALYDVLGAAAAAAAASQPLDTTLTALAAYNTNGIITQTAADTFVGRTITAGTGIAVADGDGVSGNPTVALGTHSQKRVIGITIDGGGSAITTGVKGYIRVPFTGTIVKASLLADQSGSIVIDVWKDTYANAPPTDADSITASAPPTISTATKSEDATLTGWTTAVTAGDVIGFNVDSVTTITRVTLTIDLNVT